MANGGRLGDQMTAGHGRRCASRAAEWLKSARVTFPPREPPEERRSKQDRTLVPGETSLLLYSPSAHLPISWKAVCNTGHERTYLQTRAEKPASQRGSATFSSATHPLISAYFLRRPGDISFSFIAAGGLKIEYSQKLFIYLYFSRADKIHKGLYSDRAQALHFLYRCFDRSWHRLRNSVQPIVRVELLSESWKVSFLE